MFINELAERRVVVIFCGRFQPFHRGHAIVYNNLVSTYGRNNVYIGTSGKVEPPDSPFTLSDRIYFMNLMGIPSDRILQLSNNYNPTVAAQALGIQDLSNTVMIFPVSQKDVDEKPGLFSGGTKKDGSPKMLQPLPQDQRQIESADKHAYIQIVNVQPFKVLGQTVTGATKIRDLYIKANDAQRQQIIKDLYGKYTYEAEKIMNDSLLPSAPVTPVPLANKTKLQKVAKPEPMDETVSHFVPNKSNSEHGYYKMLAYKYKKDPRLLSAKEKQELQDFIQTRMIKEEAGGVGVIASKKQARDPRYSHSLTRDVRPGQVGKNLRAFKLAESNIDKLAAQLIDHINQDIDAIKQRFATEKLPADYKERLKQKIEQLKARRQEIMMGR
jgi:hypothetical protein